MSVNQGQSTLLHSGNRFHEEYTTTNMYVKREFGFPATQVSFANDSTTDTYQVSFDGSTLHYTLPAGEYKDIPGNWNTSVYVKATTGGDKVRISAI